MPVFACLAGLGLAYFALSGVGGSPATFRAGARVGPVGRAAPASLDRSHVHRSRQPACRPGAHRAARLVAGARGSYLGRRAEGRAASDCCRRRLQLLRRRHLKPRGLAIVGLAAVGAALIVLSSTRPLTSEALVMVAAFVAWPVLTFAEHERHVESRPGDEPRRRPRWPSTTARCPLAPPPSSAKSASPARSARSLIARSRSRQPAASRVRSACRRPRSVRPREHDKPTWRAETRHVGQQNVLRKGLGVELDDEREFDREGDGVDVGHAGQARGHGFLRHIEPARRGEHRAQ